MASHADDTRRVILDLEIDGGLGNCGLNVFGLSKMEPISLHRYCDIPEFLKVNPYILDGYRSLLPFNLCVKSIFLWCNETVNIWSHLFGFLLFSILLLYENIVFIPNSLGSYIDHSIFTISLLCYQFCMLCSSGFHLFYCHSEKASYRWLAVDLAGISVGIIGVYLPGVHYAFYCFSLWHDIYLLIIMVLSLVTLYIQLQPKHLSDSWILPRILIYCALVGYGIVPALHWIYLSGGWSSQFVQIFIKKVIGMYMLGIVAMVFYVFKIPERLSPGTFDFVGSSHQFWHILILLAFLWWLGAIQEIFAYRTSHPCPA